MKENTIKQTFTPGPWKCYPVNPMQCNNNRTFEIHGFETEKSVRDVLPTEVESNAKLIAAAPELLETIDDVSNRIAYCIDLWNMPEEAIAMLRGEIDVMLSAIKKATE